MKIAYLIAAHTDPLNLKRLIKSLRIAGVTDFYIHVDAKICVRPFLNIVDSFARGGVKIVNRRIFTQWGGYSQCLYQQALIDACVESGENYDRVFFISGQDYPLWSNEKILNTLSDNPEKEFIQGLDITMSELPKIRQKLVLYHFFRDVRFSNPYLKKALSGGSRLVMKMLPFRKKPFIRKMDGSTQHVYQGSSWWCMTFDCIKYVYHTYHTDKRFETYFRYSFAPDEMMIQTIVFNSPYGKNAILSTGEYKGLVHLTPLHYIEYGKQIAIFQEHDYDKLINSGKMFCRKVKSGVSDTLLDKIDKSRK